MLADSEIAFAKINLALHVRSRRDDGYHDIETIFAFVDGGDRLSVEPEDALELHIEGPFADDLTSGRDNLVLRTAKILKAEFGIEQGASLLLDKRLPIASGIGGGSADAAATARLLNRFWNIGATDGKLADLLAPLGADIPACIFSRPAEGRGTGTDLREIDGSAISGLPLLLVNPRKPVSTAAIFARWDGIDRGALRSEDLLDVARMGRNDLEQPAIALCPDIADILDILADQNPLLARMSGSGATCFALFSDPVQRDLAAAAVAEANIAWWMMKGSLR